MTTYPENQPIGISQPAGSATWYRGDARFAAVSAAAVSAAAPSDPTARPPPASVVQHAVMVPAMLGVMLWRYDEYATPHAAMTRAPAELPVSTLQRSGS